jgi:transcriptional regulator with XRE-family HTH domain
VRALDRRSSLKRRFGQGVRELRTKRGFTQESFAEVCGLHRTYVGSIERGERNVSLENLERIATALEVEIADLFPRPRARR